MASVRIEAQIGIRNNFFIFVNAASSWIQLKNTSQYSIQVKVPTGTVALAPGATSPRVHFNTDSGARIYAQGVKVTSVMDDKEKIELYTSDVIFGRRWISCYLFGLLKVCGQDEIEV